MTVRWIPSTRLCLSAIAACSAAASAPAAEPAAFDLPGPELSVSVSRAGRTLPIGKVPALATGDVVKIEANLPADQSIRYRLISAFLRGVTNPPPKSWIANAETWQQKEKKRILKLTVPDHARQLVLFMVPDTGGDLGTISDAIRGRPGEFVRVTQDINKASLDRSRLNAFIRGIRSQENTHPEFLRNVAPVLSSSLAVKLNPDCLAKVVEFQAACLVENRDSLVLGDIHSNSLTETIIGAPTDLALQLSATREGGYGFYSPYIGVVRDLARIFGAFNNPEFNYLPALGIQNGGSVSLLLNSAPSFRKPKSVLVAALPAIEKNVPPPLRKSSDAPICATRPGAVFGVDGAPLIFATDYAYDIMLRLPNKAGRAVDVPVVARADKGGYIFASSFNARDFKGSVAARVHGFWGFDAFEGPEFAVQFPEDESWQVVPGQRLIAGQKNRLAVKGASLTCVRNISVQLPGGRSLTAPWQAQEDNVISIEIPSSDLPTPGEVKIVVQSFGVDKPTILTMEASLNETPSAAAL
ncbi:hypothetical protein [Sphingobium tyrosinilyticum]|uniref:Uncharacterized protein n=1 Tax=Sphingobium tyrosinilyticum TaxID=2715436 RepID=A0ABV9F1Z9_9SPHN